ncbi:MAG: glycosyltransferase family 4 protein [Pirellulaceae bacterium]
MSKRNRDGIRIGVWCAYHVTLEACEGIGVFAHNLALGLSENERCQRVDMVCKPGDAHVIEPTAKRGNNKIRAVELPRDGTGGGFAAKLASSCGRKTTRAERKIEKLQGRSKKDYSERWEAKHGKKAWIPLAAIAAYALGVIRLGILRVFRATLRFLQNRILRNFPGAQEKEQREQQIIEQCDVWLIPYVLLDRKFSRPTVVTVHDLVAYHFPEMLSEEALESVMQLASDVAEQSTLAACMSKFIERNDLQGVLRLPPSKTRMVEPWVPKDFGKPVPREQLVDEFPVLNQRYFFYPAGFRPYKNHSILVEALSELCQQGNDDLHLVFTGIQDIPQDLCDRIEQLQLSDRVTVLQRVSREVLSTFYKHAIATVVPSLYEQGSYPLMEALYFGCPIASSDIESLRERFDVLGESMVYFDARSTEDVAQSLRNLAQNETEIRARQQAEKHKIFGRSAADAGADWLSVLEEAISAEAHRHSAISTQKAA